MSKSRTLRPGSSSGALWYFAAAITLAVAMMSCGGKGQPSETAAPANPAAKPVDAATAGTVTRSIQLDGPAPKPRNINMAAEPHCARRRSTPAPTEDVVPGDVGTLQAAPVYLKRDLRQHSLP